MSIHFMHASKASTEYHAFVTGDHIGMESYVDLRTDFDDVLAGDRGPDPRRRAKRVKEEKEYPPPIPCLARAYRSVYKRYYTNDGRLVIKEEKANNRMYLRSVTADGRLTLQIVQFNDDDVLNSRGISDLLEEREEAPIGDNVDRQCDNDDGGGEDGGDLGSENVQTVANGGGGERLCYYKYDSLESSGSCMSAMPMPAIRPVQIYIISN